MRLGGFVIHGDSKGTLELCLRSLLAVCDEVVAVDSDSTDGSAELSSTLGVRRVNQSFRGYGAARARAAKELAHCDYLFFLDSDEWLEPDAVSVLRAVKLSRLDVPLYTVRRRNWVALPGRRFRFFTDTRARLIRKDAALWRDDMIVHEALPPLPRKATGAYIEHTFADSIEGRAAKDDRYALLWALRMANERKAAKSPSLERTAHLFKHLVLNRGLFHGRDGVKLSAAVARYHARKHEYLAAVRRGEYAQLVECYARGDYEGVFREVATLTGRI